MTLDLGGEFRTTAAQVGEPAAADPYAEIIENCRASKRNIEELLTILEDPESLEANGIAIEKVRGLIDEATHLLTNSQEQLEAKGYAADDCVPPTKPETIKAP